VLQADRRSLLLKQPISASNNVRITANDEVNIPNSGVYSSAYLKSFQSGPFRIAKNQNDFTIQNRQGSITVSLPIGTRVKSSSITSLIQKELDNSGIQIKASSENGFLTFEDTYEKGPSSFVRVSGNSLSALGLENQVRAKGKEIYPPWELDERTVPVNLSQFGVKPLSSKYPKFRKPIKGNPILKVSYATMRDSCYRCLRTGVENDMRVSQTGGFLLVRNEDKLYQDSLKIILTIKGTNRFFPEYGSLLITRIGSKILQDTQGILQTDVQRALERFRTIQRGQRKYQLVTPRESLQAIQSINVFQSEFDLTTFGVRVTIRNASNQPVVLNTVFAVPGSIALLNSRNQSLGAFGSISNLRSLF
jgi:hypothetical protein